MSSEISVNKLIEYLRIKTVHPNPDYESAIKFLNEYSKEVGFDSFREIEVSPGRIVCVLSYFGTQPEKKSILLNSHTDVVPADEKYWKCDPFEGKRYDNGDIYARGVQDMKSVGIMHLELIREMINNKTRPERTIHLSFVPDEEIGGLTGFAPFLETDLFKSLNVGLALDEGMANPGEEFCVYYGERLSWWVTFTCRGNTGHGSRFIEKTAAEKLQRLLNALLKYREEEKSRLAENTCLKLGDVTTVNLTKLSGGLAGNVVPPEFKASFDVRITPKISIEEVKKMFDSWIREAEGDDKDSGEISYEFDYVKYEFGLTSINENENPWWKEFQRTADELGLKLSKEIFPAGTDCKYIRDKGIPAFGFTPLNHTPTLLHDHNEFINEKIFLKGIDILYKVVLNLANLKDL